MHTLQISYKGFTTVFQDETEGGLFRQIISAINEELERIELEFWLDSFDPEEPFVEQVKERAASEKENK